MFSFKAIIDSRGYHVYKERSWSNAKMNKEVKVELKANVKSLPTYIYIHTLSGGKHWDIFHVKTLVMFIFLLKKKMRKFLVHLESLKYKAPPILLGYWTFLIH